MSEYYKKAKEVFASGETKTLKWRFAMLDAIKKMILDHEKQWCEALMKDLGKPEFESINQEILYTPKEISQLKKDLPQLIKETHIPRQDMYTIGNATTD